MSKAELPNRVRREICRFARQNGVRKVILFGSRARGVHADRSDPGSSSSTNLIRAGLFP